MKKFEVNLLFFILLIFSFSLFNFPCFLYSECKQSYEDKINLGVARFQGKFNMLQGFNVNLLRLDVYWGSVETEDNQFAFSSIDENIMNCQLLGAEYSPTVYIGKNWANGYPGHYETPSLPPLDLKEIWDPVYGYSKTYYDFIYHFIDHIKGYCNRVYIEDEVSTQRFWVGTCDEYVRIVKTAYKAAKDADPSIQVSDSGLPSANWGSCIIRELIRSGVMPEEKILDFANGYFYRFNLGQFKNYNQLYKWIFSKQQIENYTFVKEYLLSLNGAVDVLNFHFCEDYWYLPKVLTYIDSTTQTLGGFKYQRKLCNETAQRGLPSPGAEPSEVYFASQMFKTFISFLEYGVNEIIFLPYCEGNMPHDKVGLVNNDYTWRKQAYTFSFMVDKIADKRLFVRKLGKEMGIPPEVQVYLFRDPLGKNKDKFFIVMWWDDGSHGRGEKKIKYKIPGGIKAYVKYNLIGNKQVFPVTPGQWVTENINSLPVSFEAVVN